MNEAINNAKSFLIRLGILLVGGLVGAGLAVLHVRLRMNDYIGMSAETYQERSLAYQTVIIFVFATYNVGFWGLKLCSQEKQMQDLRMGNKWHNYIINAFMVILFVVACIWE